MMKILLKQTNKYTIKYQRSDYVVLCQLNAYLLSNGRICGDFDEISSLLMFNFLAKPIKQTPVMYES